ncbi:MAG TPA: DUF5700 domain-containing putative Zn-dependent protease [Blastocatellia bacterium]|nr:DUF5700 domain-containing putative Zn-dependent protease [Blastocatellia bacterium]
MKKKLMRLHLFAIPLILLAALPGSNTDASGPAIPSARAESPQVDVRVVADEAEAVLSILSKKRARLPVTDADWQRLFSSEGYVRLKKRETSMRRPFEEADFKSFVLSAALEARATALEETLERWKRADVARASGRALAYLPKQASLRAKIYPSIKPRDNSFVFEVKTDPAIFLYLDEEVTGEQFENTLAHELHHIGYGGSCPSKAVADEVSRMPRGARDAVSWIGAFGEGLAMLAAAGGPDIHPHLVSKPEERKRWDLDMANFNDDLTKVDRFLLDVLEKRLSEEEEQKRGFEFFGVQGPWYTVGWKMASTIEKTFGRAKLIESACDKRKLLAVYNDAARRANGSGREGLALWSASLVERVAR